MGWNLPSQPVVWCWHCPNRRFLRLCRGTAAGRAPPPAEFPRKPRRGSPPFLFSWPPATIRPSAPSSSGQDVRFSSSKQEFDSPRGHVIRAARQGGLYHRAEKSDVLLAVSCSAVLLPIPPLQTPNTASSPQINPQNISKNPKTPLGNPPTSCTVIRGSGVQPSGWTIIRRNQRHTCATGLGFIPL